MTGNLRPARQRERPVPCSLCRRAWIGTLDVCDTCDVAFPAIQRIDLRSC